MESFNFEQARERLRKATAALAYSEQPYSNCETAGTFSQYRKRLLEEKHVLTGEVLRHLGLQWVAPYHDDGVIVSRVSGSLPRGKLLPYPSSPSRPERAERERHVQLPPFAAGRMPPADNNHYERVHEARLELVGRTWVGPAAGGGRLLARQTPAANKDGEPVSRRPDAERLRFATSPPIRQPEDHRPYHHRRATAAAATARYAPAEWDGRNRYRNSENEGLETATKVPGSVGGDNERSWAFPQHREGKHSSQQQQQQQQQQQPQQQPQEPQRSPWRQLKKLNHQPHPMRPISPSLVAARSVVLVESGPPLAGADERERPCKRLRRGPPQAEKDADGNNASASGRACFANSVSPVVVPGLEAGPQHASLSPSPPLLPRLGSSLGAPQGGPTSSGGGSFSSASDHSDDRVTSYVQERDQPRAVGAAGGGGGGGGGYDGKDNDQLAVAAAGRVLGLGNGHMPVAEAAVAATQPTGAAMAGPKRAREIADVPMPAAVDIVRKGDATPAPKKSGKRFAAGSRQIADKSKKGGTGRPSKRAQACRDFGCGRRPIYAYKGDTKALCCPIHRSKEMVNVRHPLCRNESCFRQPSFGMEGDQRASFCSEHKAANMINVSSRRCQATGCLRHPNFGFQGDRRATFCCRHKAPGMIDVVSRRCQYPECVRRPLYANAGQRAMFCRTHKDPTHTDVVSRRCNFEEGCDRHPSFGWKHGDGKARRCAHHRLQGMESVKVNSRRGSVAAAANAAGNTTLSTSIGEQALSEEQGKE